MIKTKEDFASSCSCTDASYAGLRVHANTDPMDIRCLGGEYGVISITTWCYLDYG